MAEVASYIGVDPRTIKLGASAVARGFRVTKDANSVCAVSAIGVRGDFITLTDGAAAEHVIGVSASDAGKVPAYASENTTAGALAYSAADGKFSVTSTNAVLMGKWATATTVNTLGEVELFPVA